MNSGTDVVAAADGSAIAATYEVTYDDIAALAYFQACNDVGYQYARRSQSATQGTIIVLVGAVFAALQASMEQAMVALGISMVIAAWFAWSRYRDYPQKFSRYVTSRYRDVEAPGALGPHKLSVGSTGITVTGDHSTSEMQWSVIAKVECTDSHIFAFIGPMNALIIPRRSLQGASFEEVRSAFLRYCPVRPAKAA